jgi:hypothetical protein
MKNDRDRIRELQARVRALDDRLRRERKRTRVALSELEALEDEAEHAGIAGESVYGRPSMADARHLQRDFTKAVLGLSELRKIAGFGAVRLKAAANLDGDLALLEVADPKGPLQVGDRDLTHRALSHPAWLASLSSDQPGRNYAIALYLRAFARSHAIPTFRRVFDKSAEIYESNEDRRHRG